MVYPAPVDTSATQLIHLRLRELCGRGGRKRVRGRRLGNVTYNSSTRWLPKQDLSKHNPSSHAHMKGGNLTGHHKTTGQRTTGQPRMLRTEEVALPRDEPPNWLPNTKHSALKSRMCKQHWLDSASCIYISAYVCSNRIKEKEARNLRRMEVEDTGRTGGRKGNGEKWCNCILINEENIAYKTEEISVLRPCSVSSSPSSLGMFLPL